MNQSCFWALGYWLAVVTAALSGFESDGWYLLISQMKVARWYWDVEKVVVDMEDTSHALCMQLL